MANEQANQNLVEFSERLRRDLYAYISVSGISQKVLASTLGVRESTLSTNMVGDGPMGERFVKTISEVLPDYRNAYAEYLHAKARDYERPADQSQARQLRITRILSLRDDMIEMVNELADLAKSEQSP